MFVHVEWEAKWQCSMAVPQEQLLTASAALGDIYPFCTLCADNQHVSGPRLVSCLLAWLWSRSWGAIGVWLKIWSFGDEMATLGESVPLQEFMTAELRTAYSGKKYKALATALGRRRKSVEVSHRVAMADSRLGVIGRALGT